MSSTGGRVEWTCSDATVCADLTTYRVESWNAATGAYQLVRSVPALPDRINRTSVPMQLGATTFFRITGLLAGGSTPAAVVHGAGARGDFV